MPLFEQRLANMYAAFPQLKHTVAALPVRPAPGIHSLNCEALFNELAAQSYRPESWLDSPESLTGPFVTRGDCLAPLIRSGAHQWVDPSRPAADGDVVLIQWHPRTLEGIIRRNAEKPEWLAMYGEQPLPTACKLLRHFGREHWLFTNESALPLGRNRILGVVRHWRVPHTSAIVPGAATSLVIVHNSGSFPDSGVTSGIVSSSLVASGSAPAIDCTVIVTVNVTVALTGGAGLSLYVGMSDGANPPTYGSTNFPVSVGTAQYTLQWEFSHSAANTSVQARVAYDNTAGGNSWTVGPATFQFEFVKR
jgi:hypothetical protein